MKTICTLLISFFILSSIAMANESSKPENCLATRSTDSRHAGKDINEDKEEEEVVKEVQSN